MPEPVGTLVDGRGVEQFTTAYPSQGSVLQLERNRETSTNLNVRSASMDLHRPARIPCGLSFDTHATGAR